MPPPVLDYAPPPPRKLEWQFLRSTLGVLLFVFAWFCFSLYLWHRFGSSSIGREPELRLARDLCAPNIYTATLIMTGLNAIYLTVRLILTKRPLVAWLLYLTLALLPLAAFLINELCFADFTVS